MKRKVRLDRILILVVCVCVLCFGIFHLLNREPVEEKSKLIHQKSVEEKVSNQNTMTELLEHSIEPLGSTLYVWGGGWNEEDTAAGKEAKMIGVSEKWKIFYDSQSSSYKYLDYKYQIHDGLDCSGYIGWLVYNTLEEKSNGQDGYVYLAQDMASKYASLGFGDYHETVEDYVPGDIMSTSQGHVYMVLSACEDGSVLLIHASPPGVRICGTPTQDGNTDSQAVKYAQKIMSTKYADFYSRYPDCSVDLTYLTEYTQMRWNQKTLKDPDHIRDMNVGEIVDLLFHL